MKTLRFWSRRMTERPRKTRIMPRIGRVNRMWNKTAIGATLERGGYVQFSAHGLAAGSGYYVMMPDQLEQYRRAVDDDKSGTGLEGVV